MSIVSPAQGAASIGSLTTADRIHNLTGNYRATQGVSREAQLVFPKIFGPGWVEVPGGWRGPMTVQFSESAAGLYRVEIACDSTVHGSAVWQVPEGGRTKSVTMTRLPSNSLCGLLVSRVTSETSPLDNNQIVLDVALYTGARTLTLQGSYVEPSFYPYPDGYKDKWFLDFIVSQGAQLTATFKNLRGTVVATRTARGRAGDLIGLKWNGTNKSGRRVAPGPYTVSVTAANVDGQTSTARVEVLVAGNLNVAPGRVGKVRVGMTKKRAMKTKLLRSNVKYRVPGVCAKTYPLLPKAPHENDYQPFLKKGKIREITVYNLKAARLPKGLSYKSTAAKVRRAYKGKAKSGKALYSNNTLFVRSGRNHIAYIFKSQQRKLRPKDRLLLVSVSRNAKPMGLADDGC